MELSQVWVFIPTKKHFFFSIVYFLIVNIEPWVFLCCLYFVVSVVGVSIWARNPMPHCRIGSQLENCCCRMVINLENSTKQALNHACKLGWLVYQRNQKSKVTLCLTLKMRLTCDIGSIPVKSTHLKSPQS